MQDQSFHPAPMENPALANPLLTEAAKNHGAEVTNPADILPVPYPHGRGAYDRGYLALYREATEEYLPDDQKYKGWKLVTVWAAVIVGSWTLMIGCVLMARALLA